MTQAQKLAGASIVAIACALGAIAGAGGPAHADALLAGTIVAADGSKMGGVTVSAKADGSSITTSVYTDQAGEYYFPPLPEGKYKVWAQALTFQRAVSDVQLDKAKAQNFVLTPMKNKEDWIRQLPGDEMLAALPGDTPDDFRMKTQVRKNCTGCHSASYALQYRFDEEGWSKILDLMKMVNVLGVYKGDDAQPTGNIQFHQKELAAYLARARGPGDESSMAFKLRPRPSGEAARVVIKEYDFPMEGGHNKAMDGSDWSQGTPSGMNHVSGVHDAQADFDGNIWITYAHASLDTTVARIDGKTGEVKKFKLDDQRGFAQGSHGITRDENGILWFNTRSNIGRMHGGLGRIDPKTQTITVYLPPRPMSGTSGTIDADLHGHIWVTTEDGALRFDIKEEKFTEFKSVTKLPHNVSSVYGLAADSAGNAWWLLMKVDLVEYSDISTGKTGEFKMPPEQAVMENLTPEQRKMYETFVPPDFNNPYAWAQAPRRMGADKNGDYVWVGNSFGGNLARIDIKTKETTLVPLPNPETDQPYQVAVDSGHSVWTHLWSTDKVAKYDPSTQKWTLFDLPTRGTESRHISLLERPGSPMQIVVPYDRARKVAVMTPRSEAEIAALKAQVGR